MTENYTNFAVDHVSFHPSKRLTGSELAAEYWRASRDELSLVLEGWEGCWHPSEHFTEAFERFATLAHYDEEAS